MDDIPTTSTILTGVERAAIDRLTTARDIVLAADIFLEETPPDDADEQQNNALIAIEVLEPLIDRLATVLVAAVTKRPGGAAKLGRTVRDAQLLMQEVGAFPDTHRMANVEEGRAVIEELLGGLLSEIALENHDVDLMYEVDASGDHVMRWRELPTHIADIELMRGLIQRLDDMLMGDTRTSFEHTAALEWFIAHMPTWEADAEDDAEFYGEQRMLEWTVLDRIVPGLGSTAAAAFPLDQSWRTLTPRHQRLSRALAESVPGVFIVRGASADGVFVDDALGSAKYEIFTNDPPALDDDKDLLFVGRLVPYDGRTYLPSPGTDIFALPRASARALRSAARDSGFERADRALAAEEFIRRALGLVPPKPEALGLARADAREMLASYEEAPKLDGALPPDLITRDWMATLREIANREPEQTDSIET